MQKGYLKQNFAQQEMKQGGSDKTFNTDSYLLNPELIANKATPKQSDLQDVSGKPRKVVTIEDGILNLGYRLPTEAEWEYAAYGLIAQNPSPRKKEGKTGEELESQQQIQLHRRSRQLRRPSRPRSKQYNNRDHLQMPILSN